jgi:hypothetical protein
MATFYDKVVQLCTDAGTTISDFLVNGMKVKKSVGTGWRRGGKPQRANLLKIVRFFGVSEEYLLDDSVPVRPGLGDTAKRRDEAGLLEDLGPVVAAAIELDREIAKYRTGNSLSAAAIPPALKLEETANKYRSAAVPPPPETSQILSAIAEIRSEVRSLSGRVKRLEDKNSASGKP